MIDLSYVTIGPSRPDHADVKGRKRLFPGPAIRTCTAMALADWTSTLRCRTSRAVEYKAGLDKRFAHVARTSF